MIDWQDFRSFFPALQNHVYLNTAGGGVMSRQVAEAAKRYFDESLEMGDIGWDTWIERSEQDRSDVAQIIGAKPEHISFLPNASLGSNILARSFEAGSLILALDKEFPSCTTPFLRAGCEVEFISTDPSGYFDADMLMRAIEKSRRRVGGSKPPRAFVISSVQYANGFRADIPALGSVCRENGVLFMVDATQSIGAFPLNLAADGVDAVIFSGYKWATAGYGNAVLATGDNWIDVKPPLVGWRSARDAYKLENHRLDLIPTGIGHEMGHPAFPGIFAMAEALRLLSGIGIESISNRILSLTSNLRQGLGEQNVQIRSHQNQEHFSGIVLAEFSDSVDICRQLRRADIWTTARDGGLRISVHAYNTEEEIERFLAELERLA